jgi:DNA (cytosine-5)-methyltransferase 1
MFRKAEDPKSNLMLTALSWVDFMRPKLCVLENVRGFLQFNLAATQLGKHKVEGGISMGGLKFVLRALVAMKYFSDILTCRVS